MSRRTLKPFGDLGGTPALEAATARTRRVEAEPVIGPVEVGIPVPPKPGRAPSDVCDAVAALQPGQSRLFANVDPKRLYGYAKRARQRGRGSEYAVRAVEGGHRVWRVA